jgi:NADPH-dependent 2,4-dienoyl-CoA reductase/sulfur reductase-like enzyme
MPFRFKGTTGKMKAFMLQFCYGMDYIYRGGLHVEKVIIIGAGPCGLSAAIDLMRAGLDPLVLEKNVVVHSISQYPTYMQFFSTPELLEIGDYPFTTPHEKPSRLEALTYYRNVADRSAVRIQSYERVTSVVKQADGAFQVESVNRLGETRAYRPRQWWWPQDILIIPTCWASRERSCPIPPTSTRKPIPIPG